MFFMKLFAKSLSECGEIVTDSISRSLIAPVFVESGIFHSIMYRSTSFGLLQGLLPDDFIV